MARFDYIYVHEEDVYNSSGFKIRIEKEIHGSTRGCGCCSRSERASIKEIDEYIEGLEAELKTAKGLRRIARRKKSTAWFEDPK